METQIKVGDSVYSKMYGKIGKITAMRKEPLELYVIDFGSKELDGDNAFITSRDDLIPLDELKTFNPEIIKKQTELKANGDKAKFDSVNHPAHYTAGKVECIDALEAATTGLRGIEAVCTANAIKYLWRQSRKNGVEDLKKAIFYIERLIQHYEMQEQSNG